MRRWRIFQAMDGTWYVDTCESHRQAGGYVSRSEAQAEANARNVAQFYSRVSKSWLTSMRQLLTESSRSAAEPSSAPELERG